MWNEIQRVLEYLSKSDGGKRTLKYLILGLIAGVDLLIFNLFVLYDLVDLDHFFIHTALSRLLFINNISPYSLEIQSILENYFSTRPIEVFIENFKFTDPIFQLFFYFPFGLIPDPKWAAAIYLTINQGFIFWIIETIYRLLDWKPDWKIRILNGAIAFLSFLGISFLMAPDLSVIQTLLFLIGLSFSLNKKPIPGGLLLGFSLLSFQLTTLALLLVITFFLVTKKKGPVVWFLITIVLLSLAGIIFDNNWLLMMLRSFFLEPQNFPFTSYSAATGVSSTGAILPALINFSPVFLVILIALEWLRTPKVSSNHLFWLLAFIINLNPMLTVTQDFSPKFIHFFVYLFIFYLWYFRSEGTVKQILLVVYVLMIVILPGLGRLLPHVMPFLNSSIGFHLLRIFLTLIMLYWVKWWILQSPLEREVIEE
jgi:hypothetical protein